MYLIKYVLFTCGTYLTLFNMKQKLVQNMLISVLKKPGMLTAVLL